MCGRYTIRSDARQVAEAFRLGNMPELSPRYNVAPTQDVPVVRQNAVGQRELSFMHWGLIPSWAKDASIGNRTINARADTVAAKPAYRRAFKSRRCLVVADGFYEWHKTGGKKQPYLITVGDGEPFAFAGLWEHWQGPEGPLDSCTIITTPANDLMQPIHDRMPAILLAEHYDIWLDPKVQDAAELQSLLGPYPSDHMSARPVSTLVNNPRNETAEVLEGP